MMRPVAYPVVREYHGSRHCLPVGTILRPGLGPKKRNWRNEQLLESRRPPGQLSRSQAVFVTPTRDGVFEAGGGDDYVYRVEPLGQVSGPFDGGWVDRIILSKQGGEWGSPPPMKWDDPRLAAMADAYWRGDRCQAKNCSGAREYLAEQARIVEVVLVPYRREPGSDPDLPSCTGRYPVGRPTRGVQEGERAREAADGLQYVDQGLSPLSEAGAPPDIDPRNVYGYRSEVYRYALIDPSAPPPEAGETYFVDTFRTVRTSPETGRPLKKPRTYVVPGAPPGTVAFVDWIPLGAGDAFIAYVTTRKDLREHGYAGKLVRALYRKLAADGITYVDWGKVMSKRAWGIMQAMQDEFPAIQSRGKVYF